LGQWVDAGQSHFFKEGKMAAENIQYVGEGITFENLPTRKASLICHEKFSKLRKRTLQNAVGFSIVNLILDDKGCTVTIQPFTIA